MTKTRIFLRSDSSDEPAIYCGSFDEEQVVRDAVQNLMSYEVENLFIAKREINFAFELVEMTDEEVENLC